MNLSEKEREWKRKREREGERERERENKNIYRHLYNSYHFFFFYIELLLKSTCKVFLNILHYIFPPNYSEVEEEEEDEKNHNKDIIKMIYGSSKSKGKRRCDLIPNFMTKLTKESEQCIPSSLS